MGLQYFSIDQAENTEGEHLQLATSSEVNMVSPQQTKALHLQLRPLPSLPNMLAPPLPAPRPPNMLAPPLPAPRIPNMSTPPLPAPRDPSTKLPCDSPPPLPPPRKKPLIQREANVTPSSVIQKRFLADVPKTFSRKNQAVFVAVLLCVVVITVPTVHMSFFSGGLEISSHGLFFVHNN